MQPTTVTKHCHLRDIEVRIVQENLARGIGSKSATVGRQICLNKDDDICVNLNCSFCVLGGRNPFSRP